MATTIGSYNNRLGTKIKAFTRVSRVKDRVRVNRVKGRARANRVKGRARVNRVKGRARVKGRVRVNRVKGRARANRVKGRVRVNSCSKAKDATDIPVGNGVSRTDKVRSYYDSWCFTKNVCVMDIKEIHRTKI